MNIGRTVAHSKFDAAYIIIIKQLLSLYVGLFVDS